MIDSMDRTDAEPADNPFLSPAAFVAVARVGSLMLAPAGDRLVATVDQLDTKGGSFTSSLWALDPGAVEPARRLTRSDEGESHPAFLPDGSLLFTSTRPRPSPDSEVSERDDSEAPALWLLPADGGEPYVVITGPGGVGGAITGRDTFTVVIVAKSAPGLVTPEENRQWWKARRAQKVSAVLHESGIVRHWDHHIGPHEIHLYAATIDPSTPGEAPAWRDLTPDAGHALFDSHPTLSADGSVVLVDWKVPLAQGRVRSDIVAIDLADGVRRTLTSAEDGAFIYEAPEVSGDGRQAVALRTSRPTPQVPWRRDLWLIDLASGAGRALSAGDEPMEQSAAFNADDSALIVTTDCQGRAPLFQIDLASGESRRLTGEGAWASPQTDPGGEVLYALHSSIDEPPRPVRLALTPAPPASPEARRSINAPGSIASVPGRVEEVTTTAADGTTIRSWLVVPESASPETPAPLVLWVHGGPVSSWNGWHWRWNPWVLAARGWAVLLPDPALSSGYGDLMLERGWGQWGGVPYDDLMAATDSALERPDVDASRTAAMGGSYGGYMANWIAGHTDRFSAIVSHASLWSLEQFRGTTDYPAEWADEWGYPETNPELYQKWSPDNFVDAIRTPMLLTHGERDYRCPVSESIRLWSDLTQRGVTAKFLWFAGENHWILQPGDAVVWYETVLAFLDEHVLARPWQRPSLL
jgi:dipeptidyl aminopeptidase/acylaminoacyl peptidase